jgi:hypothetical protein
LRKAEYHRSDTGVWDRVSHWVGDRLTDLFSGSPGGDALLVLLVLLAAVVIFAVVRAGVPRRAARAAPAPEDPLAPATNVDHRARAAAFAHDGRRAEAVREWLRAAIQTIEERGVLAPKPGRTGAATAREAGPSLPQAAPQLDSASRAFDEVFFGGRAATDADVAVARSAAESVRR